MMNEEDAALFPKKKYYKKKCHLSRVDESEFGENEKKKTKKKEDVDEKKKKKKRKNVIYTCVCV